MPKKYRPLIAAIAVVGVIVLAVLWLRHANIVVLNPKGVVGQKERNLMIIAAALSLIVVLPVFALTFGFAWRYRAGNKKAKYSPNLDGNRAAEFVWWLVPAALILVLSVITWRSTHELDPYKALASSAKPMTIQVVALDWKWLFIYPGQRIATVNYVQFPAGTPIDFEITADAPMNSFWIPQLGGQIYAMPGMTTHLHLMASEAGSYDGSSANISGAGFAGMKFVAKSTSHADFNVWLHDVQHSPKHLGQEEYTTLAKPSTENPVTYYASADPNLYDSIVMKFMMPMTETPHGIAPAPGPAMPNMNMNGMDMNMEMR